MTGKILIVDDEPQIRRVMKTALTSEGYAAVSAKSAAEAFEKLRQDRFDLVLLDVNMPGESGLEACSQIRNSSDIAIIMLTVRNIDTDKVAALDAGGNVEINLSTRHVHVNGRDVRFTPKEFDMLHYLVTHPYVTIPHRQLLQGVWGPDYGDELSYLHVFVYQIRKKIEVDPGTPRHLVTELRIGYRFSPHPQWFLSFC